MLPYTCVLCGCCSNADKQDLCRECKAELPWLQYTCYQCARPLPKELFFLEEGQSPAFLKCGWCQHHAPYFDSIVALWEYKQPVARFVTKLKFNHELKYAKLMGELMVERLHGVSSRPDCIIPMPLHKGRLRERGFNQALEIARPIAKKLNIPLALSSCVRVKATEPQSSIPAHKRRKNVFNAFSVAGDLAGKHIAIVDDVVTTAYTIRELSKQLKHSGTNKVDVWCCARTL